MVCFQLFSFQSDSDYRCLSLILKRVCHAALLKHRKRVWRKIYRAECGSTAEHFSLVQSSNFTLDVAVEAFSDACCGIAGAHRAPCLPENLNAVSGRWGQENPFRCAFKHT